MLKMVKNISLDLIDFLAENLTQIEK